MRRGVLLLALAGVVVASIAAAAFVGAVGPSGVAGDGVDANENPFLSRFPYVAAPNRGYEHTGHK